MHVKLNHNFKCLYEYLNPKRCGLFCQFRFETKSETFVMKKLKKNGFRIFDPQKIEIQRPNIFHFKAFALRNKNLPKNL